MGFLSVPIWNPNFSCSLPILLHSPIQPVYLVIPSSSIISTGKCRTHALSFCLQNFLQWMPLDFNSTHHSTRNAKHMLFLFACRTSCSECLWISTPHIIQQEMPSTCSFFLLAELLAVNALGFQLHTSFNKKGQADRDILLQNLCRDRQTQGFPCFLCFFSGVQTDSRFSLFLVWFHSSRAHSSVDWASWAAAAGLELRQEEETAQAMLRSTQSDAFIRDKRVMRPAK